MGSGDRRSRFGEQRGMRSLVMCLRDWFAVWMKTTCGNPYLELRQKLVAQGPAGAFHLSVGSHNLWSSPQFMVSQERTSQAWIYFKNLFPSSPFVVAVMTVAHTLGCTVHTKLRCSRHTLCYGTQESQQECGAASLWSSSSPSLILISGSRRGL